MNKQFVAVITVILFISLVFIYDVYSNVTNTYRNISSQVESQQTKRNLLTTMHNAARERSLILLQMMAETDEFILDEYSLRLSLLANRFINARQELYTLKLSDREKALLSEQTALTKINAPLQDKISQLFLDGAKEEATTILLNKAIPVQTEILNKLAGVIELGSIESALLVDNVNQKLIGSKLRFGLIFVIFLALVLFLFFYAFRSSRKEQRLLASNLKMQQEISEQLQTSKNKLSQYTDALSTFTVMLTTDGMIELVNNSAATSMGSNQDNWVGRYFFECYWWGDNALRSQIKSDIQMCASGQQINKEVTIRSANGEKMIIHFILTPIRNSEQEITYLVAEGQDITERKLVEKKISYQASHDALTDLINRYEFEHRLSLLLQRAEDHQLHYVFYLDLDQFKIVNDTCGHSAGDALLRQIPRLIQPYIRQSDVLARLGGDEFGIILENSNQDNAKSIANEIINAIRDYQFAWEGKVFRIGVSIGIVEIDDSMTKPDMIMKWIDSACYAAKDKGRNTFHFYVSNDEKLQLRAEEMGWISRIESALQENLFELYAQPIMTINSDKDSDKGKINYELLLRMNSNTGIALPGAFLPAAERYDKAIDIDYWVFSKAFELFREYPDFLPSIGYCAINISAQSLTSHEFLTFLTAKFAEMGSLAPKFCIEVTETTAIANLENAQHFISTLREKGVTFALDDFGSGLSSFGYLKTLKVDKLKIDGMFVKDIANDQIDHAMVKSIHEVGTVMGLKTVAEFVENDSVLEKLKQIGVNYAQGYGIGKPQPLIEILQR
ncbi:EAL domain-containing protein [Thiomicrorhabdus xiamenensis]|uniref:EAL domain-containing protein n=1 Tax=Thiomicrorhabdus xiamenensis TaxID=2739063 RepID=A0A7D4SZ64_9GAMM|nr:EAL domain-containing protein [Thiomicrorhabdus xiamenensis]QKI89624.1 EAL domain-containing protein [Thiomicrorhabdus xiamenensis]